MFLMVTIWGPLRFLKFDFDFVLCVLEQCSVALFASSCFTVDGTSDAGVASCPLTAGSLTAGMLTDADIVEKAIRILEQANGGKPVDAVEVRSLPMVGTPWLTGYVLGAGEADVVPFPESVAADHLGPPVPRGPGRLGGLVVQSHETSIVLGGDGVWSDLTPPNDGNDEKENDGFGLTWMVGNDEKEKTCEITSFEQSDEDEELPAPTVRRSRSRTRKLWDTA
jgi:hypothetical protein